MGKKANDPATAPTVPGHGSISHPQMDTKMNKHLDSTEEAAKPVSRRNFIALGAAGLAALPAVALADALGKTSRLPHADITKEEPWVKARRLTVELSATLAEVDDAAWFAKVYPSCAARGWTVMFGNIESERCANFQTDTALKEAIAVHKAARAATDRATVATDAVAIGRDPSKAEQARLRKAWKAEDVAMNALLSYVPHNDVSRRLKATYLLPFITDERITGKQMRILLTSMCGRCA